MATSVSVLTSDLVVNFVSVVFFVIVLGVVVLVSFWVTSPVSVLLLLGSATLMPVSNLVVFSAATAVVAALNMSAHWPSTTSAV